MRLANGKPRTMDLKHIAYSTPSQVQLPLGTRIIAQYKEEVKGTNIPPSYYAGIIAETPSNDNQQRYLIFFDDGCAEYCPNQQVCCKFIINCNLLAYRLILLSRFCSCVTVQRKYGAMCTKSRVNLSPIT